MTGPQERRWLEFTERNDEPVASDAYGLFGIENVNNPLQLLKWIWARVHTLIVGMGGR